MKNTLAVKALNQYRKRDIFPYLGLRYYLNSKVASNDRWINEVSIRLARMAKEDSYLRTYHFKGMQGESFEHRDIYVPAPNEILAETALLTEISKFIEFNPKPYVYSYRFAEIEDKSGVFQPYFNGFKERHQQVSSACKMQKSGTVFFTDIKKFYPSIRIADALRVWKLACDSSGIEQKYKELGEKILKRQNFVSTRDESGNGILTGPLFSHVIANLLLNETDVEMHKLTSGNYLRYVDDVVLIGTSEEVKKWREVLADRFDRLNLKLHDGEKDFEVSCDTWLDGELDFNELIGNEWISLIGDMKRFLLANPGKLEQVKKIFIENHIRLPIVDYSNAVKEASYLRKIKVWSGKYRWSGRAVRKITIESLLSKAQLCEIQFSMRLNRILEELAHGSLYEKKRKIPKIRYLGSRLLYLSSRSDLLKLSSRFSEISELILLEKTMRAVATLNLSDVVRMGANAAHMASQLIRVDQREVVVDANIPQTLIVEQSLAVIELNGIKHNIKQLQSELSSLAQADNMLISMKSKNGFVKEFACLHGLAPARHEETLETSFDMDEELALDLLNQLQNSSHC